MEFWTVSAFRRRRPVIWADFRFRNIMILLSRRSRKKKKKIEGGAQNRDDELSYRHSRGKRSSIVHIYRTYIGLVTYKYNAQVYIYHIIIT